MADAPVTSFSNGKDVDLNGKSVLVTGGTGSFGKKFVQTVLERYKPRRLIIFSRDELKQYEMAIDLSPDRFPVLRYFIGDVRDAERLDMALRDVDVVVHAAALKQVPAAEYNPFECIQTNVIGAENVVRASLRNRVKTVIALSTDKAANPINLYGASKLASDKIFVAANNLSGHGGTSFSVVRYGNVMGSRGSVIPFFRKLIDEGADSLPITDTEMTRFWITLQQGVDFVLSSLALTQGGELFVPKIPSMKMTELAFHMAPDLPHRVVGIRPGEKIHEVLITEDDARNTLDIGDRYIVYPEFSQHGKLSRQRSNAKPVPAGFRFASNINDDWLSGDRLATMIAECAK
ncbi:UDP-N-acetylglucosamine 4,6-dehydratase (inverting) [Pelagibius sp. 7325]|uniref:UDP-N-acetylglucosamine 4,6-dehydratase (inverting) n=1 Tax=Pelagibius sp. 7325 TaxID=3131994 RepID=UPI0030ED8458